MKNKWLIEAIEKLEDRAFHGKIVLNMRDGDVPNIEIDERINKPEINPNKGKDNV
jgi:hypothetical protein